MTKAGRVLNIMGKLEEERERGCFRDFAACPARGPSMGHNRKIMRNFPSMDQEDAASGWCSGRMGFANPLHVGLPYIIDFREGLTKASSINIS